MTDSTDSVRDPKSVNDAINGFLAYYVDPKHPLDYAVLISGPWGSGKTFLVKRFLETSSAKPLYVSLYGMTSVSQIEDEFYRQLHPVLSHKGMKIAGAVAKAVLKGTVKIDLDGNAKDDGTLNFGLPEIDVKGGLADPRDRLLVFDDLERCKMPIGEVLGYINSFVEHDGLKAIILANETRLIAADDSYVEIKEKLIGQTLEVAAAAEEAFAAFVMMVDDVAARNFLESHREVVLGLHSQGGRGNLRTLKHAMWDFEKIARHLDQRHWNNEPAMLKLLKGTLAVAMEHRAGALDEKVLRTLLGNRIGRLLRTQNGTPKGPAEEIEERYPQVDFDDTLVGADVFGAVLMRGESDGAVIRAAIDSSSDFVVGGAQPLWLRAQHAFRVDDDACEALAAEVEAALAGRAVRDRGELMHLFGVRLWFARIGLIAATTGRVVEDGQAYIAALEDAGRIVTALDEPHRRLGDDAFGGYRVIEFESPEYRALAQAYGEAALRSERARYLAIAHDLMRRLPEEPDEVLLDLVPNNVRAAPYYDRPVLAALPPAFVVECVLGWSASIQERALEILHGRHELQQGTRLAIERAWVDAVRTGLEAATPPLRPMSRHRLNVLIARFLTSLPPAADSSPIDKAGGNETAELEPMPAEA